MIRRGLQRCTGSLGGQSSSGVALAGSRELGWRSASSQPRQAREERRDEVKDAFPGIFAKDRPKEGRALHRTQYNVDPFSSTPEPEHYDLPLVDAAWLAKQTKRPRKVRMLTRDFIHDSLYNPHYGYFSRHAVLLPDGQRTQQGLRNGFDFQSFSDERDFMIAVEERYKEFEETMQSSESTSMKAQDDALVKKIDETLKPLLKKNKQTQSKKSDEAEKPPSESSDAKSRNRLIPFAGTAQGLDAAQRKGRMDLARQLLNEKERNEHDRDVKAMAARQVWHTPTELFKPHYAHAVARYMLETLEQGKKLIVYEVGAGSGALAKDILDFIRSERPEVYKAMRYHIIEISQRLSQQQCRKLDDHVRAGRVIVTNKSILDWEETEEEPCFFVAMEVLDNLTHDVVRFSTASLMPFQSLVSIDSTGDMHELYEPATDDKIRRCLSQCTTKALPAPAPAWMSYVPNGLRKMLTNNLPFYPNLTEPQFLPTGSLQLLDVLHSKFPHHRMIASDFDALPDSIEGINSPVVQTRLNGTMIAVSKYTVLQGFFDIFFPTDFKILARMHSTASAHKNKGQTASTILSHRAFLERYGDVASTTCKDGSNPMLSWYGNASWFLT